MDNEDLDRFLNTGILSGERVIYLNSSSASGNEPGLSHEYDLRTSINMNNAIKSIMYFNRIDHSPIYLIVNMTGAEVHDALALYDVITTSESPVITIGLGSVFSSGCLILACGYKRYAFSNCYLMNHDSQHEFAGKYRDLVELANVSGGIENKWNELMAKHTKKDANWWGMTNEKKSEVWLDSGQMLEVGVIDGIVDTFDGILDAT